MIKKFLLSRVHNVIFRSLFFSEFLLNLKKLLSKFSKQSKLTINQTLTKKTSDQRKTVGAKKHFLFTLGIVDENSWRSKALNCKNKLFKQLTEIPMLGTAATTEMKFNNGHFCQLLDRRRRIRISLR